MHLSEKAQQLSVLVHDYALVCAHARLLVYANDMCACKCLFVSTCACVYSVRVHAFKYTRATAEQGACIL